MQQRGMGSRPVFQAGSPVPPAAARCGRWWSPRPRLLPVARFHDFVLSLVELGPGHFNLAAIRAGHLHSCLLGVQIDPFRFPAAACADGGAVASLTVDGAFSFHIDTRSTMISILGILICPPAPVCRTR